MLHISMPFYKKMRYSGIKIMNQKITLGNDREFFRSRIS